MKRKFTIVVALVLTIVLLVVSSYQAGVRTVHKRNIEEKESLCVYALSETERWFEEWQETRNDGSYQRGVLCFSNFTYLYETLGEDNVNIDMLSANTYYDFLSLLLSRPLECQEHMEDILEAITVLKTDLHDINTYRMFRALADEIGVEIDKK